MSVDPVAQAAWHLREKVVEARTVRRVAPKSRLASPSLNAAFKAIDELVAVMPRELSRLRCPPRGR